MSKGSRQRQGDKSKFESNYDKIFGAKNVRHNEQVSKKDGEAIGSQCAPIEQKEEAI